MTTELKGTQEARMQAAMKMWDAACGLAEETRDLLSAHDAFDAMLRQLGITIQDFHKALKARNTKS